MRLLDFRFARGDATGLLHTLAEPDRPRLDTRGTCYTTSGIAIMMVLANGRIEGTSNANHSGQIMYFTS